ncbi:MAG TPA: motility protein A [Firmicutes bacterium]|nr:motility protein A [Bacillota bacterium]
MDIATIIGFICGSALIVWGMSQGGSGLAIFFNVPSLAIVIGGGTAAVMVCFPMKAVIGAMKVVKNAFMPQVKESADIISTIVSFAEKARREGLLTLEEDAQQLNNEFMSKAIQLVVDGTDPELVRDILEIELAFLEDRHKLGKDIFEQLGAFLPAFGMIGTLIGLIAMLARLDDPSSIGSGMAVALITTFYGAVLANFVALPIAKKLSVRSQEEVLIRQVIVEGVLSIQNGENPRIVSEKLKAFFPPAMRSGGREDEESDRG